MEYRTQANKAHLAVQVVDTAEVDTAEFDNLDFASLEASTHMALN